MRSLVIAAALALALPQAALGFAPDGCERQRAQFPKRWNDTSREKPMASCIALGTTGPRNLTVKLGAADSQGRALMSVTTGGNKPVVHRIWLDREQAARLRQGEYLATVIRKKNSCWIRGFDEETDHLFIDSAAPARSSDEFAPRVSLIGNTAMICGRSRPAPQAMRQPSCEQQRAQYPKAWDDVSRDKPLFDCNWRGTAWRIKLGSADTAERSMMSVVRARFQDGGEELREDPAGAVYRAWLDPDQVRRLKAGYFASMVRDEDSCWTDGTFKGGEFLYIDTAEPPSDSADMGSFYNKAPRFGLLADPLVCKPVRDTDR